MKRLAFSVKGIKFEIPWGVPRMTTQVDDGVQQRFDFTSTFASGEKKEKYENGINRRIDRTLQEEKMRNIITELSREMIAWKRQWLELARTNEQYKREDTVEDLKGDYQRTIEDHTGQLALKSSK